MDIPQNIGGGGYCKCGAYGHLTFLSDSGDFAERAKKALGADTAQRGERIEIVDGGTVFEERGEPVIIQWAKKPQ
jgi:hypothetical protein